MTAWNVEETFRFIELYRNASCIWNPKDRYHKDKVKLKESWEEISEEMGIGVVELKKKKETLMTAFRCHLKKKKESIRAGARDDDVYKPIWIFYEAMEAFLKDVYECKNAGEEAVYVEEIIELPDGDRLKEELTGPSQKEKLVKSQKEKLHNLRMRKRRATNPPELIEVTPELHAEPQTVIDMSNNIESDNECALYGKLLGVKLKQFPPLQRTELMYEIDGLILKKRQMIYSQRSTSSPHIVPISRYSEPTSNKESGDGQKHQRIYITGRSVIFPQSQDILTTACETAEVIEQEYVLPHNSTQKT